MESYLSERTGGRIDQAVLQQQYSTQLEAKLRERDTYWEQKIEELKLSLASVQGQTLTNTYLNYFIMDECLRFCYNELASANSNARDSSG